MPQLRLLPDTALKHPAGITPQLLTGWLGPGVTGMQAEFAAGGWVSDDLLAATVADLGAFYWQSHTLTHLARDNLGAADCDIEDGGERITEKDHYCMLEC